MVSASPEETRRIAAQLAAQLQPGDCVALVGELGAGKTEFVRGIAATLLSSSEVSSPSFVRLHSYGGNPPLYHADFYLAKSAADAADYGLHELFASGAIVLVEWADRFPRLIPPDSWWVTIVWPGASETARRIEITRK